MGADGRAGLLLSAADYKLVLELVDPAPAVAAALHAGVVEGMFLRFPMSDEAVVELTLATANAIGSCRRQSHERALGCLVTNIIGQLARRGVRLGFDPLEAVRAQAAYNRTPQADLGGFSPEQLHYLFSNDWQATTPGPPPQAT